MVASNQEHVEIVLSLLKDDKEFAVAMLETHLKEAPGTAYQAILIQKDRLPESIRSINIDTLK